jgi:carbon monoxide dehydrogenase subunit G
MINIHESFGVAADPRTVWNVISDPQEVVSCVPGASIEEQREDRSLDASVAVKFGPVKVTFHAQVTLELDDAAMVGQITARGRDTQGGTRATSTMTFKVAGDGKSGSNVTIDGGAEISGRLAGVIESGAPIVVGRMSSEFANNLAKRCATLAGAASAQTMVGEGDAG